MARLDLARDRARALENIEVYRALQPEQGQPRGNFGIGRVGFFISCALVGYADQARPLLVEGRSWIDDALTHGEDFGDGSGLHLAHLHQAKALADWLEDGTLGGPSWDAARTSFETAWRMRTPAWSRQEIVTDGLDDYMAFAILGDGEPGLDVEGYEAALSMYESFMGSDPVVLGKRPKPRELGYAICAHYARQDYEPEQLVSAGHRMLRGYLAEEWLGMGQYIRAATWLMALNWHGATYLRQPAEQPIALDALLAAYDDMNGVVQPE
ncbi:hypothetical protein [Sphingomonas sp. M1A8_2b]